MDFVNNERFCCLFLVNFFLITFFLSIELSELYKQIESKMKTLWNFQIAVKEI